VEVLIGVSVDVSELESSAADHERQAGLAVHSDPDIQALVKVVAKRSPRASCSTAWSTGRGSCQTARPRLH
jgi:hypothetical protein